MTPGAEVSHPLGKEHLGTTSGRLSPWTGDGTHRRTRMREQGDLQPCPVELQKPFHASAAPPCSDSRAALRVW